MRWMALCGVLTVVGCSGSSSSGTSGSSGGNWGSGTMQVSGNDTYNGPCDVTASNSSAGGVVEISGGGSLSLYDLTMVLPGTIANGQFQATQLTNVSFGVRRNNQYAIYALAPDGGGSVSLTIGGVNKQTDEIIFVHGTVDATLYPYPSDGGLDAGPGPEHITASF